MWVVVLGGRAVVVANHEPLTRQEAAERAVQHLEVCMNKVGLFWSAEHRQAALDIALQAIRLADSVVFSMTVTSDQEGPSSISPN